MSQPSPPGNTHILIMRYKRSKFERHKLKSIKWKCCFNNRYRNMNLGKSEIGNLLLKYCKNSMTKHNSILI